MRIMLMMLFVLTLSAAVCRAGVVRIVNPNGGENWKLGKLQMIGWGNFGTPTSETHVNIVLFRGGTDPAHKVGIIARDVPIGPLHGTPVISGTYGWTAGVIEGGMTAPAGTDYYIQVIGVGGYLSDFSDGPFSLILAIAPDFNLKYKKIEFNRVTGCPMCGIFEIGTLLEQLGNPADLAGSLVLMRGGRLVGSFGKLGRGGLSPTQRVKLLFSASDFALIGQGGQGFEVAIIGDSGRILQSKPIVLKMKQ